MNEEEEISQDQAQDEMPAMDGGETQTPGGPPRSFRDQPIYQLAFEFQQKVLEITKSFPEEELYALSEPLRLASRKIGAAVAEAWVKRRFQSQYPGKLAEVEAHAAASDHWIGTAEQAGYLAAEAATELRGYVENIRGNVWRMTPRTHHGRSGGGPERGPDRGPDRRNFRANHDRPPRDDDRSIPPRRNYRSHDSGGRYYNNRNNRGYYQNRQPEPELREPGEFRDSEATY